MLGPFDLPLEDLGPFSWEYDLELVYPRLIRKFRISFDNFTLC